MGYKSKAIVIFSTYMHIQNYVESGCLEDFFDFLDCIFFVDSSVVLGKYETAFKNRKIVRFKGDLRVEEIFKSLCYISMVRMRNVVPGFRSRLKRLHASKNLLYAGGKSAFIRQLIKDICEYIKGKYYHYCLQMHREVIERIVLDCDLARRLASEQEGFIFIPCSAVSQEVFISALLAKKKKEFTDICIIDNWDNLCSKSVFLVNPTGVCVYSEQSFNFARRIHGMREEDIFIWGSPRYDLYCNIDSIEPCQDSIINVLYAGTSIYYDEISDLSRFCKYLEFKYLEAYKVTYLPHPWRFIPKRFLQQNSDDLNKYNVEIVDRSKGRDLGELARLISCANFIISGPSSIILESLLVGKRTLISARSDVLSHQSPASVFYGYEHFFGLESNPLVRIVTEYSNWDEDIEWAGSTISKDEICESKKHLDFFIKSKVDRSAILEKIIKRYS